MPRVNAKINARVQNTGLQYSSHLFRPVIPAVSPLPSCCSPARASSRLRAPQDIAPLTRFLTRFCSFASRSVSRSSCRSQSWSPPAPSVVACSRSALHLAPFAALPDANAVAAASSAAEARMSSYAIATCLTVMAVRSHARVSPTAVPPSGGIGFPTPTTTVVLVAVVSAAVVAIAPRHGLESKSGATE